MEPKITHVCHHRTPHPNGCPDGADGRKRQKTLRERIAISNGLRRAKWSSVQASLAREGLPHELVPARPRDGADSIYSNHSHVRILAGECHWCGFYGVKIAHLPTTFREDPDSISLMVAPVIAWGVEWRSADHDGGQTRRLQWSPEEGPGDYRLFRTKAACERYIRERYGYIANRHDLRGGVFNWRMPKAVRVIVEILG